jgi:hypothetical protein
MCTCPVDLAIKRNSEREVSKRIPEEVIRSIERKIELPNSEKYHWESNFVELNMRIELSAMSLEFIEEAFAKKLSKPEERETKADDDSRKQTLLHKLDIETRKCLNQVLSELSSDKKAKYAKILNSDRREFLDELRKLSSEELSLNHLESGSNGDVDLSLESLVQEFRTNCKVFILCEDNQNEPDIDGKSQFQFAHISAEEAEFILKSRLKEALKGSSKDIDLYVLYYPGEIHHFVLAFRQPEYFFLRVLQSSA